MYYSNNVSEGTADHGIRMLKNDYSATTIVKQENQVDPKLGVTTVNSPIVQNKTVVLFGIKYWPSRGGTSRVAENLVEQLQDRYSITIYCYETLLRKNHPGIKVHWLKPLLPGAIGAFVFYLISTFKILFGPKVDLIHAHKTDCAIFIPLLRLRFKVIATSHEAPYRRDKWNSLVKLYFHIAERFYIYGANICTCVSEPLTQFYRKKYRREVVFLPNGINCDPPERNFQKELSYVIPENADLKKPYLVFSARRLMATKGCHTMIEALKSIDYKGQVFITGELNSNRKYVEKLRTISQSLNVYFLGFVEPLPVLLELIKGAELFIFPSEVEGMSIMLLEVASVGNPIIASDIPENTQVFNDSEVLYFQNKNVADLSSKLKYAFDNRAEMKKRSKNARLKVSTEHSWYHIAQQYDKLYRTLV